MIFLQNSIELIRNFTQCMNIVNEMVMLSYMLGPNVKQSKLLIAEKTRMVRNKVVKASINVTINYSIFYPFAELLIISIALPFNTTNRFITIFTTQSITTTVPLCWPTTTSEFGILKQNQRIIHKFLHILSLCFLASKYILMLLLVAVCKTVQCSTLFKRIIFHFFFMK